MLEYDMDPLIGREAVFTDVSARVVRHRLVTLTGPGGTGKTRLAHAVIDAARADREAFFVDLSTLTEGDRFGDSLAASLQLADEGDTDGAVRTWARSGTRLLALDNLEQARGIAAPISRLLDDAPTLHLLATSRGPVGVRGEHEVRVQPLRLPETDDPEAVEASSAGALFLERARGLGRLDPPLDPAVAADIARLCRRLDGLPLALELAAARSRILSPGTILHHLDERDVGVLRRGEGEARHRSLEAVLEWSLGLLTEDERRVLEACAVCAGTFDLRLIGAIVPDGDALVIVESLVAHALVGLDEEVDEEPRFRLLETIRLAALATLGEREEDLRRRHAQATAKVVAKWGPEIYTRQIRRAIARLDADRENLDAAMAWTVDHDVVLGSRLAADAIAYWIRRGSYKSQGDWMRQLEQRMRSAPAARARVLGALSLALSSSGQEDELRRVASEALELARETTQLDVELDTLSALLFVGQESGDRDDLELRAIVDRILEIAPATPRGQTARLAGQAAAYRAGGFEQTGSYLEAWLKSPAPDDVPGAALSATANLCFIYLAGGHLEDAVRTGSLAIGLAVDYGDPDLEAFARQNVAIALAELGRPAEAAQTLTRGLVIAAAVGTPLAIMDALRACGTIAALLGRARDAAWLLGAAEAAFAPTGLVDPEDDISSGAGRHWRAARRALDPVAWEVARREGRQADATAAFDRALAVLGPEVSPDKPTRARLRHGDLTAREVEILTLLGEGRSDIEIGNRLFISPKTASVHVANVKAKLGLQSRLEVALRARELGLVRDIQTATPD